MNKYYAKYNELTNFLFPSRALNSSKHKFSKQNAKRKKVTPFYRFFRISVWYAFYLSAIFISAEKKSYRILSFFKVIFYQKANVFLFYQHLTMKRGNYIIAHSFYKIDSFDSDCKLYVIQTEKIRRKCTICSPEHFTLQHILLPGTLWPTTQFAL